MIYFGSRSRSYRWNSQKKLLKTYTNDFIFRSFEYAIMLKILKIMDLITFYIGAHCADTSNIVNTYLIYRQKLHMFIWLSKLL